MGMGIKTLKKMQLQKMLLRRRAAESEQSEGDPREAETVNESTNETNDDDANVANEGDNTGELVVDELRPEEPVTENAADNVTQTNERTNRRRNHPRPQPSVQRIVPGKDDEAPRIEVPNPNRENGDNESEIPLGSDDKEEPVFHQHIPSTPFRKITLELNMEFETMDHFKAVVQKYNIQIGRQVFYLRNEKKRCMVIYYDPDCPWLCYCGRTNYPALFQIKTFVDKHTCPRSNKSKSVTCAWVAEELEHHEGLPCLPPPYKRPIGRPLKKRKKDSTEQSSGSQYNAKRRYG
ncbi:hypothetical protein Ahy_A02g009768 [Arachis hypogaea]|uniref:Transposase MuDR plant domain-containing protein n=1 Tax=Arachis hypogaea TaxID=3818 RepID=A0A445EI05_ARAHY|nr:hypothetical protein Ahy_A02g009768 [Arachis hypogaea]